VQLAEEGPFLKENNVENVVLFLIFASSSAESKHAINRRPNKKATQTA